MRLMQPVLLFKPPVKSLSTKGTPCLQKVSRLFSFAKNKSFKFHVIQRLTWWSARGTSCPAWATWPASPGFATSSGTPSIWQVHVEQIRNDWNKVGVKPVEEFHQFFPFVELRVLVGSWVESDLEQLLKNFLQRKIALNTFFASLTSVVSRAL